MRYEQRVEHAKNPVAQQLFALMAEKQTNLCIAADVTDASSLIKLIEKVGEQICLLKTHIDIITDFTPGLIDTLNDLKQEYNFLIFEDRKFADIGNTVKLQYSQGVYRINDWADMINAHIVPGPGIIEGLREVGLEKNRGLLLLAEMSSAGNLATGTYTDTAIAWAEKYSDFVFGFIGMRKLSDNPGFITMTPGVKLEKGTDALKQRYNNPEAVIKAGSDVIIVGRGIYQAEDPESAAKQYRQASWDAYQSTV